MKSCVCVMPRLWLRRWRRSSPNWNVSGSIPSLLDTRYHPWVVPDASVTVNFRFKKSLCERMRLVVGKRFECSVSRTDYLQSACRAL